MYKCDKNIEIGRVLTTNLPTYVRQDNTLILIDTGRQKALDKMTNELDEMSERYNFKLVILTHTHPDHIESLSDIVDRFNVDVIVHTSEKDVISGIIDDGNIIDFENDYDLSPYGINGYVVHTPGHTIGSSSIVINNEIVMIGDQLGDFYTKRWAKNNKTVINESLESIRTLIELNCKCYIPAHKKDTYTKEKIEEIYEMYISGEAVYE